MTLRVNTQQARAVALPTFHPAQLDLFYGTLSHRFVAARCGRRWGKTDLGKIIVGDDMIRGHTVGWFAPDYKRLVEAQAELVALLGPIKGSSNKVEGTFRALTGGRIDFWTLEDEHAGRSRKYHRVIVDEGAFTKNTQMMKTWEKAIKPTLLDYGGKALVLSNTNGVDPENFLYQICHEARYGFAQFHAPTHSNPHLPQEELDKLITDNDPLVYQQEYLADFVDWSGIAFFALGKLLVNDKPVEYPTICDAVYAVIDSAVKTGKDNDGTGVVFYALSRYGNAPIPLVVLDWDLAQVEGGSLITWLPKVYERLAELAKQCRARRGSLGAFIEDKTSGSILLQQTRHSSWPKDRLAHPIESKLTAMGKDERAIAASPHVYQGKVKFSNVAFDKVTTYKGTTRNQLQGQVVGFRVGDKDAAKRADDLLDCFTYGVVIGLGNNEGM